MGTYNHIGIMKRCSGCKKEYPDDMFHKGAKYCKPCKKEIDARNKQKNIENFEENKKKLKDKTCPQCLRNLSIDKFNIHRSAPNGHHSLCSECHTGNMTIQRKDIGGNSHINQLFSSAKKRAKDRGLEYTITKEDIKNEMEKLWDKSRGKYIYKMSNGEEIILKINTLKAYKKDSPSLDRIDNRFGYIPNNIWIIPYSVNSIKNVANPYTQRAIAKDVEIESQKRGIPYEEKTRLT